MSNRPGAMPAGGLIAIDVALLLPEALNERARAVNAALLARNPDGFRFDATHLPHLTLAQLFVRQDRLSGLIDWLDPILRRISALALRVTGVGSSTPAAHFAIAPSPDLQKLHETILGGVRPFEEADGDARAFYSDGEPAQEGDVAWVRQYRRHSSYARFSPHITLGIGPPPEFPEPFEFTADRAALCHLGRFCTCRVVLREWKSEPRA